MAGTRTLADAATILEKHINIVKYTMFCIDAIVWIMGLFLLGLSIAVRMDSVLEEWLDILDIRVYYIGVYVLIFIALLIIVVPIFSCIAVYQEIMQLLLINAIANAVCFLILLIGSVIVLETCSVNSGVQETIRESMRNLIVNSYDIRISNQLNRIQEDIGCCGIDGPNDYLSLRKPLPNECRDSVTGNPYFHGCGDEVIWMLQDKAYWITGIAIVSGGLHMLITVLSYTLVQSLQKEERLTYRR